MTHSNPQGMRKRKRVSNSPQKKKRKSSLQSIESIKSEKHDEFHESNNSKVHTESNKRNEPNTSNESKISSVHNQETNSEKSSEFNQDFDDNLLFMSLYNDSPPKKDAMSDKTNEILQEDEVEKQKVGSNFNTTNNPVHESFHEDKLTNAKSSSPLQVEDLNLLEDFENEEDLSIRQYTRNLCSAQSAQQHFRPNLEVALLNTPYDQLQLYLASMDEQTPSHYFLKELLHKLDMEMRKSVAPRKIHNSRSLSNQIQNVRRKLNDTSEENVTVNWSIRNVSWVEHLKLFKFFLKKRQSYKDIQDILVSFMEPTNEEFIGGIYPKFLDSLSIGPYLLFWVQVIDLEKRYNEYIRTRRKVIPIGSIFEKMFGKKAYLIPEGVKKLRESLLSWIFGDCNAMKYASLSVDSCVSASIYLYVYVIDVFKEYTTKEDVCSELSQLQYISNQTLLAKFLTEWPSSMSKFNTLKYLLNVWATYGGRSMDKPNLTNYLKNLEREIIHVSESKKINFRNFILLFRELWRCTFQRDYDSIGDKRSFFSSPKDPRETKRRRWIPDFRQQYLLFKRIVDVIDAKVNSEDVYSVISLEDVDSDSETEYVENLRVLVQSSIRELDMTISNDFQYILPDTMNEGAFSPILHNLLEGG